MTTSGSPLAPLVVALALLLAGALLPLISFRWQRSAHFLGLVCAMAGSVAGAATALQGLTGTGPVQLQFFWDSAGLAFALSLDGLAALFLLPLFVVLFCSALFAFRYLDLTPRGLRATRHWFFFNLLGASMALVVTAATSLVFLLAWEVMSLSSFFLVVHSFGDDQARRAGWLYLVATHLGTAFLFCLFLAEYRLADSLDFTSFTVLKSLPPAGALAFFFLGLVGFGTKAGMFPLHAWLPEAHSAAPSHVSALMSGVMLKTALYGLLRLFTFLPPLPSWCGLLLGGLGIGGSLYAIAQAALQTDIKKSLAYSSAENIGIILLGIGLWLYCDAGGHHGAAILALSGALLHIWNHALFKSLLFLGAGSVLHATGTRTLSNLGGLLRSMPRTGLLMLAGGAAIAALPPLNGFVSELLLYLGIIQAGLGAAGGQAFLFLLFAVLLALTGGLVLLFVTRLFGITFSGAPRTDRTSTAHESAPSMLAAMLIPALGCLAVGIAPQAALRLLAQPLRILAPGGPEPTAVLPLPFGPAWSICALLLLMFMVAALVMRQRLGKEQGQPTWGCGFPRATARMAYTAGSYTQFALDEVHAACMRSQAKHVSDRPLFPTPFGFHRDYPDPILSRWLAPLFSGCAALAHACHRLQAGQMNIYLAYIFVATVLLLGWSFLW